MPLIHDVSELTLEHLASLTTSTLRARLYASLELMGVQEVILRASVGIHPTLLPEVTPNLPLTPFINIKDFKDARFFQPFVREMRCVPAPAGGSRFFRSQRLRDRLLDPAAADSVVAICGNKAVFDIIWQQDIQPLVRIAGRAYDETPSGGFEHKGMPFSLDVPDQELPTSADENPESFEMPVRLAMDHWRQRLSEECHNAMLVRRMTHPDDSFTKAYVDRYPGHWR